MNNENLQTDVYMTTEHIKNKKPKVSFAMVMNKVLVGALILTSVAGGVSVPAYASAATTTDTTSNISINYENSVENATYNLRQTLTAVQDMQFSGIVDNAILTKLASELSALSDAVNASGKTASSDVLALISEASKTLDGVTKTSENASGLTQAKAALIAFNTTNGISVSVKEETNDTLYATKATYPTTFKDIKKGSTYYTAVSYLAKKGTIGGYKDGSFKATTNITNAKFITILMRAINPKLSRATKGNDYSAAVLKEAAKLGIYKASELTAENYTSSLTRKNMILWTARALDYMGEDVKVIADIENLITDFESISDSKYQDAAKEVYSAGIVTSKTFSQNSKVTRGTAITVIYKTVYTKARTNMSKVTIPDTPTDIRDGATLKYNDPNRYLPKAGDTWVAKDGKKTKITSISYNHVEVPGYGQGIDLYSGLVYDGTRTFKNGDTGIVWHGDDSFLGSPFTVAKDHNGKVFAYFRIQWNCIKTYEAKQAQSVKNPKDGQYCGYFTQYNKEYDDWIWVGPVF